MIKEDEGSLGKFWKALIDISEKIQKKRWNTKSYPFAKKKHKRERKGEKTHMENEERLMIEPRSRACQ